MQIKFHYIKFMRARNPSQTTDMSFWIDGFAVQCSNVRSIYRPYFHIDLLLMNLNLQFAITTFDFVYNYVYLLSIALTAIGFNVISDRCF